MKRLFLLGLATVALAGCGSSTKSSSSKSSSSPSTSHASGYPKNFETSFKSSCTSSGGTSTECGCALTHIESAVSYETVVKDAQSIESGKPPKWYTTAVATCHS
jgi:hypothetical protein